MKHFLLTRFNIRSENWKHTKSGVDILSDEWLDRRFDVFEKFCFPSVKNQSNQNFFWYVIFDKETPVEYQERIALLANNFKNLNIVYTNGFKNLKDTITHYINKAISENDQFIITTRLDNDDMIHQDFTETIQKLFVKKDKTIIDLISGYQMIITNHNTDLRAYKTRFNPFISLIESSENFETVISQKHHYWEDIPNIISYKSKALWIQLIHQDNLINDKLKALKKVSKLNYKEFGLDKITIDYSKIQATIYNIMLGPYRLYYNFKQNLKKLLKK